MKNTYSANKNVNHGSFIPNDLEIALHNLIVNAHPAAEEGADIRATEVVNWCIRDLVIRYLQQGNKAPVATACAQLGKDRKLL